MRVLSRNNGFTLVEVIMVIVILGVMATVAMKALDNSLASARVEETRKEMDQLVQAIDGNPNLFSNGVRTDFGYVGDVGSMPPNLDALVTSPGYTTWKGPYIKSDFSGYADDYKRDAWGQLYAYAGGTTIKSVGGAPDTLVRVIVSAVSQLTSNTVSGQITDAAGNPPGDSAMNLRVTLSYPNGSGGMKDSTLVPNSSGNFSFSGCVPIGNQTVRAVYLSTNDTVQSVVSILPKSSVQAVLRFPGALWAATGGGGGGGSPTSLQYVPGSAQVSGTGNRDIRFSVENPSTTARFINTIQLTYSRTAYFQQVRWGSTTVFNNASSRAGSGQTVTFSIGQTIGAYGQAVVIQVNTFRSTPSGGATNVNMSGTPITVLFSDGSTISFTTP